MIIKYDINTYKILGFYTGNIKDIKVLDNESIKELDIQDCSQTDIRAYNDYGIVKSLGQQIKEKILVLKNDEVIKDGVVVTLNKAYEEDYIKLIQRDLETLDDNKKIEYDRENKKYYIIEKSIEDKFKEGLITKEEYNNYILRLRQGLYVNQLDGLRAELLDNVINSLAEKGLLNDSQMETLLNLKNIRRDIKLQYPKY